MSEGKVTLSDLTMTETEEAAFESDLEAQRDADLAEMRAAQAAAMPEQIEKPAVKPADDNALPEWVTFPPGFKIPARKSVAFMLFKARWCEKPELGDRWCLLWPLSDADEKLATTRARGDHLRAVTELAKQTVRVIDGNRADWTKTPGQTHVYDVDKFWNEIGARCRNLVTNYYAKMHILSREDQADFLENCLFVRTLAG